MRLFIILLLFFTLILSTTCRPSRLAEENYSETGGAEYEGNDDASAIDYLREDQEPTIDEAQRQNGRYEDVQETQREFREDRGVDQQSIQNKAGSEAISENNQDPQNERRHREFINNNRGISSEKEHSQIYQRLDDVNKEDLNEPYSRSINNHLKRTQNEASINMRPINPATDYGNDMLFKMKPDQAIPDNKRRNVPEEASAQPSEVEQYYNCMHLRNRGQTDSKRFENTYNSNRDRRHSQNIKEKQNSDSVNTPKVKEESDILDESSENAIISNIKKLSEQDLEELLNSLPEDKKILLKKIMDKREITKKAGAVEENSYLVGGQSETSKNEEGYSVEANTESSLSSNTPEPNKQTENGEVVNTKNPDSESGTGASGSKSEISETNIKDDKSAIQEEIESSMAGLTNKANIYSDQQISKVDDKRETKNKDLINEKISLEGSKNQDDACSENEDWFESKNEEVKDNDGTHVETYKREITQKGPSALCEHIKSLEDSFPAVKSYDDNSLESEMAPLIRVKRTEKDHIKLKDSPVFHYSSEDENCDNEENSEFEDYGVYDHSSNIVKDNPQHISSNKDTDIGDISRRSSKFNKHSQSVDRSGIQKMGKLSLGSDTDSVLLGIEGTDENLMYNSGLRGKRNLVHSNSNDNAYNKNLIRNCRTAGPMNDAITDNSIHVSQFQEYEAFGPLSRNSEENINRYKRVKQINKIQSSQKTNLVK